MASTLKLEIVTPDGTAYSEDVDMVTLPGVEGQMGIYPQHVPLLTQMVPGEIIVRKASQDYFLASRALPWWAIAFRGTLWIEQSRRGTRKAGANRRKIFALRDFEEACARGNEILHRMTNE